MALYHRITFGVKTSNQQTLQPELFSDEQTFLIEANDDFKEAVWQVVEVAASASIVINMFNDWGIGRFVYFEADQEFTLAFSGGDFVSVKVLPGPNPKAIYMASIETGDFSFVNTSALTATVRYLIVGA